MPFEEDVPFSERELDVHLNQLGSADGWTPSGDLLLLERLARGDPLDVIAAHFRVSPQDVKARFRALNRHPGDLDHQALLLRVLRRRAG